MKIRAMMTRAMHACTELFVAALVLVGFAAEKRPPQTQEQLLQRRATVDQQRLVTDARAMFQQLLRRAKGKYDAYGGPARPAAADGRPHHLRRRGLGRVRRGLPQGLGPGPARPDGAPGVRRGDGRQHGRAHRAVRIPRRRAGDREDRGAVPQPERGLGRAARPLFFLPNNLRSRRCRGWNGSYTRTSPRRCCARSSSRGATGGSSPSTPPTSTTARRVFDLVAEARRALETDGVDRVHRIMLASSGIPGAFPFRVINDELYVDGGVTGNIVYGGRVGGIEPAGALAAKYPDVPIPKILFWVLFNNQLRPPPQVTARLAGGHRAQPGARHASATLTAMRHLYARPRSRA